MRTTALVLAMLAPAQAHALSCAWGPTQSFPADASNDVPINVVPVVFIDGGEASDFDVALMGDGVEFTTEQTRVEQGSRTVLSLKPDQDLAPNTTYTLQISGPEGSEFTDWSFTTGEASDSDAPDVPAVLSVRRERDSSEWGDTDFAVVELTAPAEPTMYRMTITDASGATLGEVLEMGWDDAGVRRVSAGEGLCGTTVELDGTVEVSVEAIDLAGNVSSASAPGTAAAGCSATTAPAALGLAFLGLGLLGLRRRR